MHTFGHGRAILLVGDIATFAAALFLTLLVRYQEVPNAATVDAHLAPFAFLFLLWAAVFFIAGLYDQYLLLARKRIPSLVFLVQFLNILFAAGFFFILPFGIEPKTNLAIYLIISTLLIIVWRLYIFPIMAARGSLTAVVIGSSSEARAIAAVLQSNPYFKNIRAHLLGTDTRESTDSLRMKLLDVTEREAVDMVIADLNDTHTAALGSDFYSLVFEEQNVRFYNLPAIYEQLHHRVPPSLVRETWFLENVTTGSPHYAYDLLKRAIDIIGAGVLLAVSLILFPFIMVAIKLEDGGAIFYRTERIGQNNRVIRIHKFRTKNGIDRGEEALKSQLVDTAVGRFLRRTRLDEFPQLINVLAGDLSFIGPRPEMPALAAVYAEEIPYYNLRHLIKPGLSGWAQINDYDAPRAGVDIERTINKLSFDLYYLKHRSLLLDIEIALKTIKTFLLRTGS